MAEATWLGDPRRLLARPLDFFPRPSQTPGERADSVARLVLYSSVVVGAYRRQLLAWAAGGVVAAAALAVLLGSGTGFYTGARGAGARAPDITGSSRGPGDGPCTMPDAANPFGNALLTDLGKASFPPACSDSSPGVAAAQRKYFNRGLIRSVYDVYERENSQRQFYTLPSPTGVADTTAVRNFLYGTHLNCKARLNDCTDLPTCKEDGRACYGFFP